MKFSITLLFIFLINKAYVNGCDTDSPVAHMCQASVVSGPEVVLDVSTAGSSWFPSCDCHLDADSDGIRLTFDSKPTSTNCGNKLDLLFEDVSIQMRCGVPTGEQSTKGSTVTIQYTRDENTIVVDSGYCIRFYSANNGSNLVLNCEIPDITTTTTTLIPTSEKSPTPTTTQQPATSSSPSGNNVTHTSTSQSNHTSTTAINQTIHTSSNTSTSTPMPASTVSSSISSSVSNTTVPNAITTSSVLPTTTNKTINTQSHSSSTTTAIPQATHNINSSTPMGSSLNPTSKSVTMPTTGVNNATTIPVSTHSTSNTTIGNNTTNLLNTSGTATSTYASVNITTVKIVNTTVFPNNMTISTIEMNATLNSTNFTTLPTLTSEDTNETDNITFAPTGNVTENVTLVPTSATNNVTLAPTTNPVENVTSPPTKDATVNVTLHPTKYASDNVTFAPTTNATENMTLTPTTNAANNVTLTPTTNATENVTMTPTTIATENATLAPTTNVTSNVTLAPTTNVTNNVTLAPSPKVTSNVTLEPTTSIINSTMEPGTNETNNATTESTPENSTTSLTTITDLPDNNNTSNETISTTPFSVNTTDENNSTIGNVTDGDLGNTTERTKRPTTSNGFWEPPDMNYDVPGRENNMVVILVPIAVVVLLIFVMAVTFVMCKRSKQALRRKSIEDELKKERLNKERNGNVKPTDNPLEKFTVTTTAAKTNGLAEKPSNQNTKYEAVNETIKETHHPELELYEEKLRQNMENSLTMDSSIKPQVYEPSEREKDLLQGLELSTIVIESDPDDANRYFKKSDPGDWYRVIMKGKKPKDQNEKKADKKRQKRKSNSHSNTSSSADDTRTHKKSKRSRRHSDLYTSDEAEHSKGVHSKSDTKRPSSGKSHAHKPSDKHEQQYTNKAFTNDHHVAEEVEHVPVQARVVVSKPVSMVEKSVISKPTNATVIQSASKSHADTKSVNNVDKSDPVQQNNIFSQGRPRNSVFGSNSKLKSEEANKRPDIVPPLNLNSSSASKKKEIDDDDFEEFDL